MTNKMKLPDNERRVFTWVRDKADLEYWQIDSFCKTTGWFEAIAWKQKVLYWQELPPRPTRKSNKQDPWLCPKCRMAGIVMDVLMHKKKYQFIKWFPIWKGFGFERPLGGMSLVYDWSLSLGFWEIRKWHPLRNGEIEEYSKSLKNERN